jgi:hypothetical protein
MSESYYNNHFHKHIVDPQSNKLDVDDVAKASTHTLCSCPGSEPGKVKIDIDKHVSGCRFQRRSLSRFYGIRESVIPGEIRDGCRLGLALGQELV